MVFGRRNQREESWLRKGNIALCICWWSPVTVDLPVSAVGQGYRKSGVLARVWMEQREVRGVSVPRWWGGVADATLYSWAAFKRYSTQPSLRLRCQHLSNKSKRDWAFFQGVSAVLWACGGVQSDGTRFFNVHLRILNDLSARLRLKVTESDVMIKGAAASAAGQCLQRPRPLGDRLVYPLLFCCRET